MSTVDLNRLICRYAANVISFLDWYQAAQDPMATVVFYVCADPENFVYAPDLTRA